MRLPSPLSGGSFSVIWSPSACRATTYDHRGCDSLQSGSRLLNLTSSVCIRVCRTASLRQLLCLLRLLYPSWNQCQQNAANGWFTKLGDYFFDTMLKRTHVLWAEIDMSLFALFFFFFLFRNFVQNKACKGHFPLNMNTFHYFWHIMILSILSTFIILLDFSFKTAFFSVFPLDIRHILVSLDSPLRFVLSVTCIVCVLRALLHLRTCWGDSQGKSNLSRHINLFFPCPCSSRAKHTETDTLKTNSWAWERER